jgi:hypothetical protein
MGILRNWVMNCLPNLVIFLPSFWPLINTTTRHFSRIDNRKSFKIKKCIISRKIRKKFQPFIKLLNGVAIIAFNESTINLSNQCYLRKCYNKKSKHSSTYSNYEISENNFAVNNTSISSSKAKSSYLSS